MSLASLVARLAAGETPAEIMAAKTVTSVTSRNVTDVTPKPAPALDVTSVTAVTPENHRAVADADTVAEIMASVDERGRSGGLDTSDTSRYVAPVSAKPAPVLTCTADTCDTSQNTKAVADADTPLTKADADTVTVTPLTRALTRTLTRTEALDLRAWLRLIGETNPATITDVLAVCERFPDTRAYCLNAARTTEVRQMIAARAAMDREQDREQDAKIKRTEAERVAKLAEDFYNHLFGPGQATGCCYGRTNRYCDEGKRLRDTYYEAARHTGRLA